MNLYKLTPIVAPTRYETYDEAVVAALTAEAACEIHPNGWSSMYWDPASWVESPSGVTAELLGVAKEGTEAGVICASYHAG